MFEEMGASWLVGLGGEWVRSLVGNAFFFRY